MCINCGLVDTPALVSILWKASIKGNGLRLFVVETRARAWLVGTGQVGFTTHAKESAQCLKAQEKVTDGQEVWFFFQVCSKASQAYRSQRINNPGITIDLGLPYFISADYHKKRTLITSFLILAICRRLIRARLSYSVC